jgi:hypothetical protein
LPRAQVLPGGVRALPEPSAWHFRWAPSGDAVAVELDGTVYGIVSANMTRGMSRFVAQQGGWGVPWNRAVATAEMGGDI